MGKGQEDMCSSWCRDSEEDAAGEIDAWAPVRRRSVSKRSTSKSRDSPASSKRRRSLRRRGGAMMAGFHCSEQVNFDSLSEDFLDCIHGKYESASNSEALKEQWVDKHRPCSIAELAVHKKKVDEVRVWLEERINASKEGIHNYTLLITGQAGVGKSAVIQAIASHLEAELCEWKTPTPTLWKEHLHNSNSGVRYMSKLDEFETFVDTLRRYPVLPSNGLKRPVIVLIDDLPVTNGKAAHRRLCECLHALTSSAKVPTVILVTEYSKDDSNDVRGCHLEELLSTLERAGAHKVCFNPLTVNSIRKTLSFICRKEEHDVAEEVLNQIARLSQGDIRHAITSLQYFCLMPEQSKGSSLHPEEHPELAGLSSMMIGADDDPTGRANIPFGRDETLSLFHALGKFLHNKRVDGVQKGATLQERLMRLPLKMDTPEDILRHAHAQARPVVDFLHENVLDFLSDESADDAWTIASYLSDADCLLSSRELLAQFAAASVSVRGVLFGNAHPSSPGWRSIRRPQLWEAERAASRNKAIMGRGLRSLVSITELAAEVKPAMRWLGIVDVQQAAQYEDEDDDDEDDEDDIEEW